MTIISKKKDKKRKEKQPVIVRTAFQRKVIGQPCMFCTRPITEFDVDNHQYQYIKTQRSTELFAHSYCWDVRYNPDNIKH